PRTLDARAVDDLFAMKQRVTASADDDADVFDVKRGHGGIREVEFVVQAHQLLNGGRLVDLRRGNVLELLARLEEHGLVPHRTAADLGHGYELLRRIEHALQYGEDRQTQTLPSSGPEHDRVAHAVMHASLSATRSRTHQQARTFDDELHETRNKVHAAFRRLLGEG